MGASGLDILLSPAARKVFPFAIECKSHAAFSGYGYYDQAASNCKEGSTPIAVVKANHREPLVLLSLEHFMELTKK